VQQEKGVHRDREGHGLDRIGHAARRIMDGSAHRAVAHATSGPCLQQNLVCVLSGEAGK